MAGMDVNGKLALSENIADVAGLSASYDGYRRFYGDKAGPAAAGFTGDQRFFLAFAQAWRSKQRPEALRNSLKTNGHAPGQYRADTARNIDQRSQAFNVQSGGTPLLGPDGEGTVWE